jgi:sulfotransferase family protein
VDRDAGGQDLPAPSTSPRMVFLGGLHRSGTSLLFQLLRDHPAVSGFRDTGVPEDEGQHLQQVYPPASAFGGEGRFGFAAGAHLTELSAHDARAAAAELMSQWGPHWDLSAAVLVEKSPPNLIRMRYLQSLFPDASFIVITRHPLEVALAQRKRVGSQPLWSLLRHWFVCHDTMTADASGIRHFLLVRYEDLLHRPDRTLADVLRFLGLPPAADGDHPSRAADQVSGAASDRYRAEWRRRLRNPAYSPYARMIVRHFEDDARRYGYSMVDFAAAPNVGSREG